METVSLKIPKALDARLRRLAKDRNESFSKLARRALMRELEEGQSTFAAEAEPYRGMFVGEPDLSSREGYGNRNAR